MYASRVVKMCTIAIMKCANHAFVDGLVQLKSVFSVSVSVYLVEKVDDKFLKSLILLASSPDRPAAV